MLRDALGDSVPPSRARVRATQERVGVAAASRSRRGSGCASRRADDPRQALARSRAGASRNPRDVARSRTTGPAVGSVRLRAGYLAALVARRRAVALQARTVGRRTSAIQLTPPNRTTRERFASRFA